MSFLPVMAYGGGLVVFSMAYYFLDPVVQAIATDSGSSGMTHELMLFMWSAALIVYLVFGGYWMISRYNEMNYRGGNQ